MEWADNIGAILGWVASAGVVGVVGTVLVQRIRSRGELEVAKVGRTNSLEQTNSELAIKLSSYADDRVTHWASEVDRLTGEVKILSSELREMREAIHLLRLLLNADSETERKLVEKRAGKFLDKMEEQYEL